MFLKRLEVVGFKSFADKVSIDFVPGVTAVVGPNGSGKSNIADSIRWVLGEQSVKSLRGSKMEDVIFAGSDARKPLNYAEVTLVLDNSDEHLDIDYSEVNVTRRVFRSGESEYFINQQPCRLKDIVELFLDSGLGKESFSIIGQGKVDEILNSKPEERRAIFEEAAGVLKYKVRKATAEKRLAETDANLHRVEDILHGLSEQLEPLKQQAEVAKEYVQRREQLKEIDIALQAHEITELHRNWTAEKKKLVDVKERIAQYEAKLKEMEEERLSLREKATALSQDYERAQIELLETSEQFEKNTGKRRLLEERKKNASKRRQELERQLEAIHREYERIHEEWRRASAKRADAKKRLRQLEKLVSEKKKWIAHTETNIEEAIEQLKADYIEVLNERASLRNEKRYIEEQQRQLDVRENRLLQDNEQVVQSRTEYRERLQKERLELEKLERTLKENTALFNERKIELERKLDVYRKQETELYETYQFIQRLKSRADVLEEMQADFSGFFQGVRAILKARERLPGVIGAVAELVQVPQRYETALEIALGGASQHIVVQTEAAAREAIAYLKRTKSGRATFLPLSVIKARTIPKEVLERIEGHRAFVGVAAQLLSVEKTYEPIMYHLLGHVLVAESLEGANEIARLSGYRYRVVTLEGDVVHAGGSMTGGMVKQSQTPLLGRKRELASLKQKLSELNELSTRLEKELKRLKADVQTDEVQLAKDNEQLEQLRENVREKREQLRALERDVEVVEGEYERFVRESDFLRRERAQLNERRIELDALMKQAETKAAALEEEVRQLEERKKNELDNREKIQAELVDDQIQLAAEKERFIAIESDVVRLTEEKAKLERELTNLKEEYEFLAGEISSGGNETVKLEEEIEKNKRRKEQLASSIAKMKDEQREIERAYAKLEQTIKEQQQQYALLADEYQKIEVKVNRMDVELDNRLNHLSEEYEISYEAAKERYPLVIPVEEARAKVAEIKLAIEQLGTVNLGAIDEYERLFERYQFLSEQRADLVEAKETLHQVIRELDEEMTTRFNDSFSNIREQFRDTFRQLFGGGEADLLLTDPDDLLSTGVEIVARPPGKKMQQLALLSGGERALTAIALLFAILRVRPVPFCVLDEVEAALDEANVARFAHYLKDFSAETQFIVITHRKGTMEEADVLYGVTMEESGVSKLVSVKLEETIFVER